MNSSNYPQRLLGKIALITGASRGIGLAIAQVFAEAGAKIILLSKNQRSLEKIDDIFRSQGHSPTLLPFDLEQSDQIDALTQTIYDRFGRLDILVGNAAVLGTLTPLAQIEPSEWEKVLKINLTANWRIIRALDPLLRLSPAGRAIFLTSSVATQIRPYWGTYAISKAALEMMVKIYAAETGMTKIRVNLVNPGATRTDMRKSAFPGENPERLQTPQDIASAFLGLAEDSCQIHGELINLSNYGRT